MEDRFHKNYCQILWRLMWKNCFQKSKADRKTTIFQKIRLVRILNSTDEFPPSFRLVHRETKRKHKKGHAFAQPSCLIFRCEVKTTLRFIPHSFSKNAPVGIIHRPFPPALGGDKEKQKTVNHRRLAVIHNREKIVVEHKLPVKLAIGNRHFTTRDKCGKWREKANHYQETENQLQYAAEPNLRPYRMHHRWIGPKTQNFPGSVTGE